jgi:hypothetical protein
MTKHRFYARPRTVLFPQLTWDKNELKEAVRNAPLSAAGTNLAAPAARIKLLAPCARSGGRCIS